MSRVKRTTQYSNFIFFIIQVISLFFLCLLLDIYKRLIGILGGSFDPAHKGHLAISKEAAKRFKLKQIIWAITKKNPFKKKTSSSLSERIKYCKKITEKKNFLKLNFYEDVIK